MPTVPDLEGCSFAGISPKESGWPPSSEAGREPGLRERCRPGFSDPERSWDEFCGRLMALILSHYHNQCVLNTAKERVDYLGSQLPASGTTYHAVLGE
jgi:hypothetical protein